MDGLSHPPEIPIFIQHSSPYRFLSSLNSRETVPLIPSESPCSTTHANHMTILAARQRRKVGIRTPGNETAAIRKPFWTVGEFCDQTRAPEITSSRMFRSTGEVCEFPGIPGKIKELLAAIMWTPDILCLVVHKKMVRLLFTVAGRVFTMEKFSGRLSSSSQEGSQAPPIDTIRDLRIGKFSQGGKQILETNRSIGHMVFPEAGIPPTGNEKRNTSGSLVGFAFSEITVVAEHFPVIGRKDKDCIRQVVPHRSVRSHSGKQTRELIVNVVDRPIVSCEWRASPRRRTRGEFTGSPAGESSGYSTQLPTTGGTSSFRK